MSRAVSVDPGTMFFQVAENDSEGKTKVQIIRNAFVEIAGGEGVEEILAQNKWSYIKDGNSYYIPGEDAIRVARMFPNKVELRRPLADGVLNKGEDKKMLVLDKLILDTVGKASDKQSVVCTCVSSPPADGSSDSKFHRDRLESMFKAKGWNVRIIEEGYAVILSEKPTAIETNADGTTTEHTYSGIGISFGAGRVNCVVAYKKMPVVAMSVARSGDWIDKKVAEDTGVSIAQITNIKETKLDLNKAGLEEDDVLFALGAYYRAAIQYVFQKFGEKFKQEKGEFPVPLDVIIAGGTSIVPGFLTLAEQEIRGMDLPFKVNKVRHAKDPRNAVVEGCLSAAIAAASTLAKQSPIDAILS